MKNIKYVVFLVAFVFLVVIPNTSLAAKGSEISSTTISAYTGPADWSFDRNAKGVNISKHTQREIEYEEDEKLKIYTITSKTSGKRLVDTTDSYTTKYLSEGDDVKILDLMSAIMTQKFMNDHVRNLVTYKEVTPVLAYVEHYFTKKPEWYIAVNANNTNFGKKNFKQTLAVTLVHEYGHLLTLQRKQLDYKLGAIACGKKKRIHVENSGCLAKKSYFTAYINEFWSEQELQLSASSNDTRKDEYYRAHRSSFASEYAFTNPVEDIAESFTEFVLTTKPVDTSTIKNQKILFFYDYPEFVKIRNTARTAIAPYLY